MRLTLFSGLASRGVQSRSTPCARRTLGYIPTNWSHANAYVEKNVSLLSIDHALVSVPRTRELIYSALSLRLARMEWVISNWEDVWIAPVNCYRIRITGLVSFIIRMMVLRLASRKVIYVRHDRFPHQLTGIQASLARLCLGVAERLANHVVTHSPCEVTRRRHYVPHPLYGDPMPAAVDQTVNGSNSYFIVFGRILPYKNIDALIPVFPNSQRLLIIGPCEDRDYLMQLRASCNGRTNVELCAEYVDGATANKLVRGSRAMLMTSVEASMIVSGSYFFALSNATPVIAMEAPFYRWSLDTNHAPGLTVCRSAMEMAAASAAFRDPDRSEIARYAVANHADAVVRHAWNEVLALGA